MINLLFNREEKRFRAGIRIPFFLGMIALAVFIQLIPMGGDANTLCLWLVPVKFISNGSSHYKDSPWYYGGLYWNKTSLIHYGVGWIGLLTTLNGWSWLDVGLL